MNCFLGCVTSTNFAFLLLISFNLFTWMDSFFLKFLTVNYGNLIKSNKLLYGEDVNDNLN